MGAWRLFQTSSSPGSSRSKPWELCNLGGKLLSSPVNAKEPSENPSEPRAKAEVQETSTTSHHVFYFKRVNPLIKAKISFCNVKFSERGMKALILVVSFISFAEGFWNITRNKRTIYFCAVACVFAFKQCGFRLTAYLLRTA